MNKYSKKLLNFLASIWKSFAVSVQTETVKERPVWAYKPICAFGRGFTLIELLVVVLVIGILAAVALPAYNRSVQKSRMSDALNVLDIASAKQQANYIAGEGYASSFNDLSLPVQGLEGNIETSVQGVKVGNFTYALQNTCVVAKRTEDDVTIYRNFNTNETGCQGEGCKLLSDVVDAVPIGCDTYASEDEGTSDIKNNSSVISCSFDKCLSSETGTCVPTNSVCIQGRIITESCGVNGTGVRMRTCEAGCPNKWSEWSACMNQTCDESQKPASVLRGQCGFCQNGTPYTGVRTQNVYCDTSTGKWVEGGWSDCINTGTCPEDGGPTGCSSANKPAVEVKCGTLCSNGQYTGVQLRNVTCNEGTGEWFVSNVGVCSPTMSCCPGDTTTNGCSWGVTKTCQANGEWGECNYKLCTGPEPEIYRACADFDTVRTCGVQNRTVECNLATGEYITSEWTGTCTAKKYSNPPPAFVQFCGTCGSQDRTCRKTCDGSDDCDPWLDCIETPVPPTTQPSSIYCSTHGTKISPEVCLKEPLPFPEYEVDFANTGYCDCDLYFHEDTCAEECSAAGKYWNFGSCELCLNNKPGYYWTGNGADIPEYSKPNNYNNPQGICPDTTCSNARVAGYYYSGHGGTANSCGTARCNNSTPGKYYTSFAKSSIGTGYLNDYASCALGDCTNTYAGKYWDSNAWTNQKDGCSLGNCTNDKNAGYYYNGHGGTNIAGCSTAKCTNTEIGKFFTAFANKNSGNGYLNDANSCPKGNCTNNTVAYAGKYWNDDNWTVSALGCSLGNCSNKTAAGKYFTSHGAGDVQGCTTGNCTNAKAGQYYTSFATGNKDYGYFNDPTTCNTATCTNTLPGKYWDAAVWTDKADGCSLGNCKNTQTETAGKYYSGHGGTAITACATSNCTNAEPGEYYTSFAKSSSKGYLDDKTSCETGNCVNTYAGKYWNQANWTTSNTGCSLGNCENNQTAGKYYSGHGKASSTGCATGNCTNSKAGQYYTSFATGSINNGYLNDKTTCKTAACTNNTTAYAGKYWNEANWTTSTTGCSLGNCTNTSAAGKYFTTHGGDKIQGCSTGECTNATAGKYYTSFATASSGSGYLNVATSCNTAQCTNTYAGKYWDKANWTDDEKGCSLGNCNNGQTAGRYYTGHGSTSISGCATGKCSNATAGQYYTTFAKSSSTNGYLDIGTSCGTADCIKNTGYYWTNAAAGTGAGTDSTCSQALCTNTVAGYYWTSHGGTSTTGCTNTQCTPIAGKYFTGHGGTSSTGCAQGNCTNKTVGKYWVANWTNEVDGCSEAVCENTNAGKYWTSHGGTNASGCTNENCTNIEAGKYFTGHGNTSKTGCAKGNCTNKPVGQYWVANWTTSSTGCDNKTCTNTDAGKYWTTHGGTSSTGCTNAECTPIAGKYFTGHGGTSKTGCATGDCTNKTIGKYWVANWTTDKTKCAEETCTNTRVGYYWNGHGGTVSTGCSDTKCTNTEAGKYFTTHGGTSASGCSKAACENKPIGQYWTKTWNTDKNSCATAACENKPAGYYWTSHGGTSSSGCTNGKCNNIEAGKYFTGHGGTSIGNCAKGNCTNKTVGKYWTANWTDSATGCSEAACTVKPNKAYFTGHGGTTNSCAWACNSGYVLTGSTSCVSDVTVAASCPAAYPNGSATKRTVITSTLSGDTTVVTYDYSKCYRVHSTPEHDNVACIAPYTDGGNLADRSRFYRYYCNDTAQKSEGSCSGETKKEVNNTSIDYSPCYKDTAATACSTYSSTYNLGSTTRRDFSNAAGSATRKTEWPSVATQCYYNVDTANACPTGYTTGGNKAVKRISYYAGGTTKTYYKTKGCYGDTSGQTCPSGYTAGGAVATKTVTCGSSWSTSNTCSGSSTSYNYNNCYKTSTSTTSCANVSGYTSKCGSATVTTKTYYSGSTSSSNNASTACGTCTCPINRVVYDTNSTGTACTVPAYKARRFCQATNSWTAWSACSNSPTAPSC